MRGSLAKTLHLCFSRIKRPATTQSSVQQDHTRPLSNSAASFVMNNFNSLYDVAFECTTSAKSVVASTPDDPSSSDSGMEEAATPDFASVYASKRFFFSSPGRSNSIIDSSSLPSTSSSPADPPEPDNLVGTSIAVPTYSPDPFADFRRSMQEMVEASDLVDIGTDWDSLHELLMCYLSLNPKSTHKFIVGAFADLLVSLMTSSAEDGRRTSSSSHGRCKVSRRYACN